MAPRVITRSVKMDLAVLDCTRDIYTSLIALFIYQHGKKNGLILYVYHTRINNATGFFLSIYLTLAKTHKAKTGYKMKILI